MAGARQAVRIVDDDFGLRTALERLLTEAGFEARGHVSAEELFADDSAADAACVVTDLKLPGLSGFELLAGMRSRGWKAPAIVMTAYDTPGLDAESRRSGADAYLAKPFAGTALLAAIAAVTGRERPAVARAPDGRLNSLQATPTREDER